MREHIPALFVLGKNYLEGIVALDDRPWELAIGTRELLTDDACLLKPRPHGLCIVGFH